jgi:hypothetical protein
MQRRDLLPEFSTPEYARMLLGMLEIAEEDVKRVVTYEAQSGQTMTLVSWTCLWHVFVVEVAEDRGTRAQTLIDTLPVPRRTIRDCLYRLVRDGFLIRNAEGLYHPTRLTCEIKKVIVPQRLNQVVKIAHVYEEFMERYGR